MRPVGQGKRSYGGICGGIGRRRDGMGRTSNNRISLIIRPG